MAIEALGVLSLVGITIILGYVGMYVFDKTGIPDIIWLMLLGVLAGPVFGFVDGAAFIEYSSLLAAVALLTILYDAGLDMDIYQLLQGMPRGTLLSSVNILLSIIVIGLISTVLFGMDLATGMLLGAIIGGTSSPIVVTIADKIKVRGNVKTFIKLESIITDPLCIVVSIALIQFMTSGSTVGEALNSIASAFSIGAMTGLILGVAWLPILDKLKGRKFDYMLTLSIVLLLYVFVESLSGSGAIAALMFGIVLGNSKKFSIILKLKKIFTVDETLKKFHNEIAFFIRSFFFVYIGLILSINPTYIIYGLLLTIVLLILRIIAVRISVMGMYLSSTEQNIIKTMAPRGLAAAVLAQLPAVYGLPHADVFPEVVFIVIIATVFYTTAATKYFYKE
jgi:potassium/hydrogen antiporter